MQMSSGEFDQDLEFAKRKSLQEPVIIMDRGVPKYVLMSYEGYQLITVQKSQSAYDWLCGLDVPDVSDIEFDTPERSTKQRPPVEFE